MKEHLLYFSSILHLNLVYIDHHFSYHCPQTFLLHSKPIIFCINTLKISNYKEKIIKHYILQFFFTKKFVWENSRNQSAYCTLKIWQKSIATGQKLRQALLTKYSDYWFYWDSTYKNCFICIWISIFTLD